MFKNMKEIKNTEEKSFKTDKLDVHFEINSEGIIKEITSFL